MLNRAVVFVSLIGGGISLLVSIIYGTVVFALVSSVLFAFSICMWKYGYLLFPYFTRLANIVEIRSGYEIPPSRDVIVRKTAAGYYAAKFVEIVFYKSVSDKTDEEKIAILKSMERLLSSIKYVVKISLLICGVNLSKYVDKIRERRSLAEEKRSKFPPNSPEVARLDREISMWNRLIKRLSSGDLPVELVSYASTVAFGVTKDEAVSRANRQAKEISTILSSSLGADVRVLSDLEMLRCFEWEFFFPSTSEELKDQVFL